MMRELCPDLLWTDARPMRFVGAPVGRRCAVARSAKGELVVFSPLEADEQAIMDLRSRGEVAAFVLPSRFHDRFYDGYFRSFPHARFLAAKPIMGDHPAWPLQELKPDVPELDGFGWLELRGMPAIREWVFLHRASRTLIVADALFMVPAPPGILDKLLLRLAGIGDEPRPCRLFQMLIRDQHAFASSLRTVLAWDFERIVTGHGEIIEKEGKAVLGRAYDQHLNTAALRR